MDRCVDGIVTPNSANTPFDMVEHTATYTFYTWKINVYGQMAQSIDKTLALIKSDYNNYSDDDDDDNYNNGESSGQGP